MWEKGAVVIDGVTFLYEAKVYAVGSPNGINDGRVSKLQVVKDIGENSWTWNNTIINYDRGWDIRPRTELEKKVLKHILDLYK